MRQPDHLDRLTELLDEHVAPERTVSVDARARMKANVLRRATASAPPGTATIRADDGAWEPFAAGIERKMLRPDDGTGVETARYRFEPGARFGTHHHTHVESCWVVEGEIVVGDHVVHAGEMHYAFVGHDHPEVVARSTTVLLVTSQVNTPVPPPV